MSVTVGGSNFVATPTADFGSGITVNSVTFISSSSLSVSITIQGTATPGSRNVTITNPDTQSDTLTNGFTVNASAPPPTVISCVPNNGNKGQTLTVAVNGSDFVATPTADFGRKITINSVTWFSSSLIHVNIKIQNGAKSGSRNVTITNPDTQSHTLVNGFTVN